MFSELNKFADYSDDDLDVMSGAVDSEDWEQKQIALSSGRRWSLELASMEDPPKAFDWRNVSGKSYVSPVKNQGKTGTCYSYAAVSYF